MMISSSYNNHRQKGRMMIMMNAPLATSTATTPITNYSFGGRRSMNSNNSSKIESSNTTHRCHGDANYIGDNSNSSSSNNHNSYDSCYHNNNTIRNNTLLVPLFTSSSPSSTSSSITTTTTTTTIPPGSVTRQLPTKASHSYSHYPHSANEQQHYPNYCPSMYPGQHNMMTTSSYYNHNYHHHHPMTVIDPSTTMTTTTTSPRHPYYHDSNGIGDMVSICTTSKTNTTRLVSPQQHEQQPSEMTTSNMMIDTNSLPNLNDNNRSIIDSNTSTIHVTTTSSPKKKKYQKQHNNNDADNDKSKNSRNHRTAVLLQSELNKAKNAYIVAAGYINEEMTTTTTTTASLVGNTDDDMVSLLLPPKRPLSAYNLFFHLERQRILDAYHDRNVGNSDIMGHNNNPMNHPHHHIDHSPTSYHQHCRLRYQQQEEVENGIPFHQQHSLGFNVDEVVIFAKEYQRKQKQDQKQEYEQMKLDNCISGNGDNYDNNNNINNKPKRKHRKTHGKISFTDLARTIAYRWKMMTIQQRCVFTGYFAVEMDRYRIQLELYNKRKQEEQQIVLVSSIDQQKQQQQQIDNNNNINNDSGKNLTATTICHHIRDVDVKDNKNHDDVNISNKNKQMKRSIGENVLSDTDGLSQSNDTSSISSNSSMSRPIEVSCQSISIQPNHPLKELENDDKSSSSRQEIEKMNPSIHHNNNITKKQNNDDNKKNVTCLTDKTTTTASTITVTPTSVSHNNNVFEPQQPIASSSSSVSFTSTKHHLTPSMIDKTNHIDQRWYPKSTYLNHPILSRTTTSSPSVIHCGDENNDPTKLSKESMNRSNQIRKKADFKRHRRINEIHAHQLNNQRGIIHGTSSSIVSVSDPNFASRIQYSQYEISTGGSFDKVNGSSIRDQNDQDRSSLPQHQLLSESIMKGMDMMHDVHVNHDEYPFYVAQNNHYLFNSFDEKVVPIGDTIKNSRNASNKLDQHNNKLLTYHERIISSNRRTVLSKLSRRAVRRDTLQQPNRRNMMWTAVDDRFLPPPSTFDKSCRHTCNDHIIWTQRRKIKTNISRTSCQHAIDDVNNIDVVLPYYFNNQNHTDDDHNDNMIVDNDLHFINQKNLSDDHINSITNVDAIL